MTELVSAGDTQVLSFHALTFRVQLITSRTMEVQAHTKVGLKSHMKTSTLEYVLSLRIVPEAALNNRLY